MNSPQPLQSIELLAKRFPDQIVGGGTVMSPDDVKRIAAVGGRLIFMPHSDPAVIRQAKLSGLLCIAGVATPTEAFAALEIGRASCRERVCQSVSISVVALSLKKKKYIYSSTYT